MDDPQTILQGALENHYQMVKQFKGELNSSLLGSSHVNSQLAYSKQKATS